MNVNVDVNKATRVKSENVENLVIDLDGFEGPLDLLLFLAKGQKVDLKKISLVTLADQYLNFLKSIQGLRIEIAADYLITASWLVFLKSQLLLPNEIENEEGTEDLSRNLRFQLLRLDAMRRSVTTLMARDQLGRDFFQRGEDEKLRIEKRLSYKTSLIELLQTYASLNTKDAFKPFKFKKLLVLSPEQALRSIDKYLRTNFEWCSLNVLFPDQWKISRQKRRSATATTFSVILELARVGDVKIKQDKFCNPIYVKKRKQTLQDKENE